MKILLKNKNYKFIDVVKLLYQCSKKEVVGIFIIRLIIAFIPALQVVITSSFIDRAIKIVNLNSDKMEIIIPLVAFVFIIVLEPVLSSILRVFDVKLNINTMYELRKDFLFHKSKLKYKYFENTKTLDLIERISKEPEKLFGKLFIDSLEFFMLLVKASLILILLYSYVWWISILLLCVSIPLVWISIKSGKANYEVNKDVTNLQRKYKYYGNIIRDRNTVDERTLFNFSDKLNNEWLYNYEVARKLQIKTERKWFIKMKSSGIFTALACIFVLFILLADTLKGNITLGIFIALINAIFSLIQVMSWDLARNLDNLSKNKEILKEINEFMELELEKDFKNNKNEINEIETVEFKNVSFKYPNSKKEVLKNISFKINKGENCSFVGKNGSGKSTIIKLMLGMYDDFDGEILINGKSILQYNKNSINDVYSVIFQDFAKYNMSIRDNIAMGNVNKFNLLSDEEIYSILDKVEFDLKNKDINTKIGKIFEDGVELSGGEWQKLAIARALFRDTSIYLLDEPTAALDPVIEAKIYGLFNNVFKNKTIISISHRLASTKSSNTIFVIDDGCLVEKGNHNELCNKNTLYSKMYEMQKEWYV